MSIEVDDEIYGIDAFLSPKEDYLYIRLKLKPYINEEDIKFFSKLGIANIAFYDGYNFNYILDGMGYSITDDDYNNKILGLNSVFFRSLNIRFMKMNKREGDVICEDPWRKLL